MTKFTVASFEIVTSAYRHQDGLFVGTVNIVQRHPGGTNLTPVFPNLKKRRTAAEAIADADAYVWRTYSGVAKIT